MENSAILEQLRDHIRPILLEAFKEFHAELYRTIPQNRERVEYCKGVVLGYQIISREGATLASAHNAMVEALNQETNYGGDSEPDIQRCLGVHHAYGVMLTWLASNFGQALLGLQHDY